MTSPNRKVLRDNNLSWAARGLYAYLSTLPQPIHESVTHLTKVAPNGWESARNAVYELETHGYLVREQHRSRGQITGYRWTLTDPRNGVHK